MLLPCLVSRKNRIPVPREITRYPKPGKNHVLLRDISEERRGQFYVCYGRYYEPIRALRIYGIGRLRRKLTVATEHINDHARIYHPLVHSSPSRSSFIISAVELQPL